MGEVIKRKRRSRTVGNELREIREPPFLYKDWEDIVYETVVRILRI
jgi:hypothetical protein